MSATPRYAAYASEHRLSPDEMLAHDKAAFPGGCMAGYIIWVGQNLKAWRAQNGVHGVLTACDHMRFDAWLADRAEVTA